MLQGATGATLVFRDALLIALNRSLLVDSVPTTTSMPRVDLILATVDRDLDSPIVDRVVFPQGRRTAAMVYLPTGHGSAERVVVSDPRSGAILGEISGVGLLPFLLFRVHDELTIGDLGHAIVLLEGIGLLFLSLSGLGLGRPSRRAAWRVRWRGPSLQRRFDLHRVAGLSLAVFLAAMGTSGALLEADFLLTGDAPFVASAVTHRDWAGLMARVRDVSRAYPGRAIEDVRFSPGQTAATIAVEANDIRRPLALDRVTVDLRGGGIVEVSWVAKESWVRSSLDWIYLLHSGTALGAAGGVMAILGLGLFTLPLLGILLWLTRRSARLVRAPVRSRQ